MPPFLSPINGGPLLILLVFDKDLQYFDSMSPVLLTEKKGFYLQHPKFDLDYAFRWQIWTSPLYASCSSHERSWRTVLFISGDGTSQPMNRYTCSWKEHANTVLYTSINRSAWAIKVHNRYKNVMIRQPGPWPTSKDHFSYYSLEITHISMGCGNLFILVHIYIFFVAYIIRLSMFLGTNYFDSFSYMFKFGIQKKVSTTLFVFRKKTTPHISHDEHVNIRYRLWGNQDSASKRRKYCMIMIFQAISRACIIS